MAISNDKLPISLQNLGVFKGKIEDEFRNKIATLNTNANEAKYKADIARSAALSAGAIETTFVLPSANWVESDRTYGDYKYSAEIALSGITSQYICNVIFDIESIESAILFKIAPTCNIDTDKVIVYSSEMVDRELTGVIVYGQCTSANGVGRTNVSVATPYYSRTFASWDNCKMIDVNGNVSTMVRIPQMTWRELGVGVSDEIFPAFIVNGKPVKALWVGKYFANDKGCSVKGAVAKSNINFDQAYDLCKNMGEGWHLITRLTWMAVALWSAKHNCQPATTTDGSTTGNMDATHSHNGLESGIWDMAGCKNGWNAGVRLVNGELQVISGDGVTFDNSAVVLESSANNVNWYCINGLTGELMKPDGSGTTANSLKINDEQWGTDAANTYIGAIDGISVATNICEKAKNMLIALGLILPEGVTTNGDLAYISDAGVYMVCAGGGITNVDVGVFCIYFTADRSFVHTNNGFRAVFCEL